MSELVGVADPGLSYGLAALVCPLGMGAMMWVIMRGNKSRQAGPGQWPLGPLRPHDGERELDRLRAEVDQLEAERERLGIPIQRP